MRQYQIDNLIAGLTTLGLLLITGWAFLSVVRRRMVERHQLRQTLLEKLPAEEMLRLLESDTGRAWLREILVGADDRRAAVERTMATIFGSIGCGVAAALMHEKALGILGIVGLAAGIGQLAAAAWASRRN